YDGFLAEFRGDGILAYFGYPIAHEDDAERTVRAGLDIIAAIARLETRVAEPLAARIGIATGLVVIGDLSRGGALRGDAGVGETPNLAARLQALAEPGTIVVAASTRRLLGDLFRLRDLGRYEVKGIAGPLAAWAVEGLSDSESRFEAVHAAGLTDLIGREDELDFLLERQRLAWKGEGQIVLISGEAGVRQAPPATGVPRGSPPGAPPTPPLPMLALPYQQRALSVHRPIGASGGLQGRRYLRPTPGQVGSIPRRGRIAGSSRGTAFCYAAIDPVRRAVSAAGSQPHATASPDARGTARSIRGSCPPATDPALVRGPTLAGCHPPRAPRSDGGAGAPTTGPCTLHLPAGVRAALGWSAQRLHLDARSPRSGRRREHGRASDRGPRAARRSDETDRRQDR